jgi:hypothetical protein
MMLAKKVIELQWEFVPGFVFSTVACIIYFCGLLGILFIGSVFVMVVGLIVFGVFLIERLRKKLHSQFSFSLFGFFWVVGSLFFFLLLIRSNLIHYDNFSHWAIVVKEMLSNNAFPTVGSNLIDFKNYPLGISSFLYYVCRFAGNYQSIMIIAQGILIFSCFYTIFGIIAEKKRFLLYAFLGLGCASLSFFNIAIRINNLLVDFLLPMYTLAIFVVAYKYRTDLRRAFISALPMVWLLTITKSTGIVFALIGLVFLFYMVLSCRRGISRWRVWMFITITSFVAVLPYLGWVWHMKTAFSFVENKFDLQNMPDEKTMGQIREIISLFIRSSIDLSTRVAMGILVFNLLGIGAVIFNAFVLKKKRSLWKVLITLDIVVLLYYIGICSLYIFSMPLDEALRLAGFERYASSIVILFAGGLILAVTKDIEKSFYYKIGEVSEGHAFRNVKNKKIYQISVLVCMAISVTLLLSEYNGMLSIIKDYDSTLVYEIQEITGDRWYKNGEEDDSRYLFYASDKEEQVTNFYMQYVGRYFLYAPNVDGICLFYEDNMENLLINYDYLIVVESDVIERYLLHKNYGVTGQEGIYKVVSMNGHTRLVFEENEKGIN